MKIKIKTRHKSQPITTVKPDYLTQKQWEGLKSGKPHQSEKTEKAKEIVAKILERDPNRFSR